MDAGPPASQTQALSDKHLEWAPAAKGPIYKELHILDGSKMSPDFKVGQYLGLLSGCLIHSGVWNGNLQWGALGAERRESGISKLLRISSSCRPTLAMIKSLGVYDAQQ